MARSRIKFKTSISKIASRKNAKITVSTTLTNKRGPYGKTATPSTTTTLPLTNKRGPYGKKYTPEQLKEAMRRVIDKDISLKKASKLFNIPLMTLSNHVNGRIQEGAKAGKKTVMPPDQEHEFAKKLSELASLGFVLTRKQVCTKARHFCEAAGLEHPFKDHPAGDSWYYGFMDRQFVDRITLKMKSEFWEDCSHHHQQQQQQQQQSQQQQQQQQAQVDQLSSEELTNLIETADICTTSVRGEEGGSETMMVVQLNETSQEMDCRATQTSTSDIDTGSVADRLGKKDGEETADSNMVSNAKWNEDRMEIPAFIKLMHLVDYGVKMGRCGYCRKVATRYFCSGCPDRPNLHPKHCFIRYHKGVFHSSMDS